LCWLTQVFLEKGHYTDLVIVVVVPEEDLWGLLAHIFYGLNVFHITQSTVKELKEKRSTVLHLLGEYSAKRLSILGYPYLSYEELGRIHWCALLKLAKALQRF